MTLPKMQGEGPLIRAAIAQLQAYMPGQVAAFNAEPANTVELPVPETYHFGGQDLLNAYAFPQIEVAIVTGDTGEFSIERTEVDHDPRANVAIWHQGDVGDVPQLYEAMLGLKRCVIECLVPRNAFGPGVEIAQQRGISWRIDTLPWDPTASSPATGRDFQKWMGSALVQFRLEDVEKFT